MLDQTLSTKNFIRLLSKHEIIKFQLGRKKQDYETVINLAIENTKRSKLPHPSMTHIQSGFFTKNTNKLLFSCSDLHLHLILKKISHNLKRLYKITPQSRGDISQQIFKLLESSGNYELIKIDISSFYENISLNKLIKKIQEDRLLAKDSIEVLLALQTELQSKYNIRGLPRGLSISPYLSEIYIRQLDFKIKMMPKVYYFARYVDDIFIIVSSGASDVYDAILDELAKIGLNTNKKNQMLSIPAVAEQAQKNKVYSITYLGYQYNITNNFFCKKRVVNIQPSIAKIKKIKSKIMHTFLDYPFNKNKPLLLKRLQILSGNYPIYSPTINSSIHNGKLKAGIFYSNPLVNQIGVFKELDIFVQKLLYTKKNNYVGRSINMLRTEHSNIQNELKNIKYSFYEGFKSKRFHNIDQSMMTAIKSCWKGKV